MYGVKDFDEEDFKNAMLTGLCQEIVDVFNEDEMSPMRDKYIEIYKPSQKWSLLKQEVSLPWRFYQSALFSRFDADGLRFR
jgi:hypothetical protein